jgi:hypothetical protein
MVGCEKKLLDDYHNISTFVLWVAGMFIGQDD